jgi:hypothetical protein
VKRYGLPCVALPRRAAHASWRRCAALYIVTVGRDQSVTPALLQRDRYGLAGSSPTPCMPANISESQALTASTTASSWATVRLRSNPLETSAVRRIWARSGDDDPGSTQARMRRSPVRVLVTDALWPVVMTTALRALQTLE